MRLLRTLRQRKSESLMVLATLSTPAVSLISGVVSARYLSPIQLGIFNSAALLPIYLGLLNCGVFTGLSRSLPIELGGGRKERAAELVAASASTGNLVSLLGFAFALLLAIIHVVQHSADLQFGALVGTAILLLSSGVSTHIDTELRGRQDFKHLSFALIASNAFNAISTGLVAAFGATGAAVRLACNGAIAVLVRINMGTWTKSLRVPRAAATELVRSGWGLLLSSVLFSYMSAADRTVVAVFMTKEEMGQFAIGSLLVNSMQILPQSLSMILFPKMAFLYGREGDLSKLRPYFWKTLLLNCAALIPISLIMHFMIGGIVDRWFPAYAPGTAAAKIGCLTSMLWIYVGVGSVIGISNRMVPYLIVMALCTLGIWIGGGIAARSGVGISGVAWCRFIGTGVLCLFTILYSYYLTGLRSARSG